MKISARNQFKCTVENVAEGAVNGHVALQCGDNVVSGSITNDAIKSLGLAEGVTATAIIKSTDVLVAVD